MMKILAFAATNHKQSMNKKLIIYVLSILKSITKSKVDIEVIDLIDYELPLYRQDREEDHGIPAEAETFYQKIGLADALIISFAEHNGSYAAVYKNLFDWVSRIDQKVYQNKPMVVMAASPGSRGGAGVLNMTSTIAPFFGMDIKAKVSIPNFYDVFDSEKEQIISPDIKNQIYQALTILSQ